MSKRGITHDNMRKILYTRMSQAKDKLEVLNLENEWVLAEDELTGEPIIEENQKKHKRNGMRVDTSRSGGVLLNGL